MRRAGIGRYSAEMLRTLIAALREDDIVLHGWSYGIDVPFLTSLAGGRVSLRIRRIPGSAKRWYWDSCRHPTIDRFTGPISVFQSCDPFLPPLGRIQGVCTVHDCCQRRYPRFFGHAIHRRERALEDSLARAGAVIVPSRQTRDDVVEMYRIPGERIRVLTPPLSPLFHPPRAEETARDLAVARALAGERPFVLFVGTIEPRKNVPRLIRAFESAAGALSNDLSLLIAGKPGWMYDDVFRALRESPCRDRITYVDYPSDEQAAALYRTARLFVYPSLFEGFGYPVFEAMASGLPVVTSNTSALAELARGAAELVDPFDVEALAGAIERLASDGLRRTELAAAGLDRARSLAGTDRAQALIDIFGSLVAN
ncbi:MAG TPA: glycosyltransferase family 1 protein [Bacteroidota bacterium]|nr:glycosyltransferase family 1 protein [Bacteroidota bacterium]